MNEHSPVEPFERVMLPDEESLSTQLASLIENFASVASDLNESLSSGIIHRLTGLLTSKKLRYFVYPDKRAASTANTINLLKQMIALGFKSDVELIYDNAQGTALKELEQLLPGFSSETKAPYTLDGVTITFFAYQETTVGDTTHRMTPGLSGQMPLCLCGGGDIPNIDSGSIVSAVKCDYFLLLQPYLWTAENCAKNDKSLSCNSKLILPGFKRSMNLDDQVLLQGDQFAYRAFKQTPPAKLNWTNLRKIPKVNTKALSAAQNISTILKKGSKSNLEFFPVAGIPAASTSKTAVVGSADGIAFEIIAATALLQKQKDFADQAVVIGILNDVSSATWQKLQAYFPVKGSAANQSATVNQLTKNVQGYCQSQKIFRNTSGSGAGIYLNKDLSGKKGAAFLSKLKPGAIVVTSLADLPPDAVDFMYASATLPSVYEGTPNANLAVNLGKPFFKLGNFTSNPYPSTFGNGTGKAASSSTPTTAKLLDLSKNAIALGLNAFEQGYRASMPPNELAQAMQDATSHYTSGQGEYYHYFNGLSKYYSAAQNDKLLQALGFVAAQFALVSIASGLQGGIFSNLSELYKTLGDNAKKGKGKLALIPTILKDGPFHSYLQTILGTNSLTLGSSKDSVTIRRVPASGSKISKVIAEGKTSDFLGTELDVTLTVTAGVSAGKNKGNNYTLRLDVALEKLSLPGAPWFSLEDTSLFAQFSSNGARLTGGVQTKLELGEKSIPFHMNFPSSASGKMVVQGLFDSEATPTLNSVFTLIGGMNFASSIPSEFADLQELSVDGLRFNYDFTGKMIESFQISLKDDKQWNLFGKLTLENLAFEITASQPTGSRKISWVAQTDVQIGSGENPPRIDVSATYPQTTVTATLDPDGGDLPVSDLVDALLPDGYHLDVDADIANLSLEFSPAQKTGNQTFSVKAGINLDNWKISLPPADFELTDIYLDVKGTGTDAVGSISASTSLFAGMPDMTAVPVDVTATFDTKNHLWSFTGQQGNEPIKVSQIVEAYLGADWAQGNLLNIDITDLLVSFTASTSGAANSYEFGGTVKIPKDKQYSWFPDNIEFSAKFGNSGASELLLPGSKARIPILDEGDEIVLLNPEKSFVTHETSGSGGKYGMLTADITWKKIDLQLCYNYAEGKNSFGITWGPFFAELVNGTQATIKFTETTTLGSMVETFVEWMTQARFGLAAPFDILNDIKLSGFELKWDFKKDTVELDVPIGPINLLLAQISGITLTYQKDGEKEGVFVSLKGSFPWSSSMLEATKLPPWRADEPSTTPSPGGAGNKYLDLRLLAAGQHVEVAGLQEVTTVQQAVEKFACLQPPKNNQVPDIGFAGDINWLFATDFGVLRIDSGKELGQEHWGELESSGAKYTFTLQVVLTDPTLYALRIACSGKAAKIFSGLDFQIIYKKVSEGLGKFSASIELPEIMRRIDVGAVTITLPTFGIEVYTNGDFQIDVGFPWNNNFSNSFSVEAIVPPGIPAKGGGGFYFGKLPAVSVSGLPKSQNGFFNPNLVFGFGAQIGLGKSFQLGILKAGFSLTAFGILQGILAKWNPTQEGHSDSGNALSLQGDYFFSLTGTFGIIGKLYGTIDFAIIKASVNIRIEVSAKIQLASYEPIPITISAKVDVSASASIDLGLFSIKVSFSFSAHVHTTFVLGSLQNPKDAPWLDGNEAHEGLLAAPIGHRLARYSRLPMLGESYEAAPITLNWSNLKPASNPSDNPLEIHLGFALTLAKDEYWSEADGTRAQQLPCYVASLFIEAPAPAKPQDTELFEKAAGQQSDSAFEALTKMVTRWVVAASMDTSGISTSDIDEHVISTDDINNILDAIEAMDSASDALTANDITSFLQEQFLLDVGLPGRGGGTQATYFPMVPAMSLSLTQNNKTILSYAFEDYNKISDTYLADLTNYFNQLAVQVENESKNGSGEDTSVNQEISIASYIYENYFTLLMKQMMHNLLSALREFNYAITADETPKQIVDWVNLNGNFPQGQTFTLADLFKANNAHPLTKGVELTIPKAPLVIPSDKSFKDLAGSNLYGVTVSLSELLVANEKVAGLLISGKTVKYTPEGGTSKKHVISGGETLQVVASAFGISVAELEETTLTSQTDILSAGATLTLSPFSYKVENDQTLTAIAQKFQIDVETLATTENAAVTNLFASAASSDESTSNNTLILAHLPQFKVGQLISEVQRTGGITHLSGMASRYYFHGMRLPTNGITALKPGMWTKEGADNKLTLPDKAGLFALSGQQLPIPMPLTSDFTMTLGKPQDADWIVYGHDAKTLSYPITVPQNGADPSKDYQRIEAVQTFGSTHYLHAGPAHLSLLASVEQKPASYPIPHYVRWQSATSIQFPENKSVTPQYLRLWTLSDALTALGSDAQEGSNVVAPQFTVDQASMDEASGKLVKTPLQEFGWATTVEFSIKKLPAQNTGTTTSSEATPTAAALNATYQINTVSSAGITVLERMLQTPATQISFASVTLGYTEGSQSSGTYFVGEGGGSVSFGISQTNLSTTTRPPGELLAEQQQEEVSSVPVLLNQPMTLVKLLWEAGITNSGGFYLYYTADKGASGLPSSVFNEKGEATLSLVFIHEELDQVEPFVNAIATGDQLNSSGAALSATAKAPLVHHTASEQDTLNTITGKYLSNLNSLIDQSLPANSESIAGTADINLTPGKTISIEQGTYLVPAGTSAPGASFASIALRFGTTQKELEDANPRLTGPDLPAGTGLRLPPISLQIGASTLSNDLKNLTGLHAIAQYFGTEAIVIAASNADIAGLVQSGDVLTLQAGPLAVQPGDHPGVQALEAQRPYAPAVSSKKIDSDYAADMLLNNFSLLAYTIEENQDFIASNMGLPIGASGKSTAPTESKVRWVEDKAAGEMESYHGAIPYLDLIKPGIEENTEQRNPYSGNGLILQTDLGWNDYYGNTILSTLDEHTKTGANFNRKPVLQGYTDQVIPLSQWPSTSANWTVLPGDGSNSEATPPEDPENFTIRILFSFDEGPFIPEQGQSAETTRQRAKSALVIVQDMLAQFNDPNGFAVAISSSLAKSTYQLSKDEQGQLVSWWQKIESFLTTQSTSQGSGNDKPASIPALPLQVVVPMTELASGQVIELATNLIFSRPHGIAVGDYAADPLTRSVRNTVAIKTIIGKPPAKKNSSGDTSTPAAAKPKPDILAQFAEDVAAAIYGPKFTMMVASGINRYAPATDTGANATWGVRVGKYQGDAISFHVADKTPPELYAPLPVSNTLISRSANIYPYDNLNDFDPSTDRFTTTPVKTTFSNIEMDVWLKQYFEFFDALLSPEYSSAILFIDKNLRDKSSEAQEFTGYMERLAAQKESLAQITSGMLAPIYQDGLSTRLASAQETFEQTLLDELSNMYSTQAVISFGTDVTAHIPVGKTEETPQVFGNLEYLSLAQCDAPKPADSKKTTVSKTLSSLISLTSPKLKMEEGTQQPLTFLLQASDKLGEITECLEMDLCYKVTALEHQISSVEGIKDYKASSWLSPIQTETTPRLDAPLGKFKVPILLRSFPETPRMVSQSSPATYPGSDQLNKITRWDYDYTYGLNFHYLQDKAHGEVQFNLKDNPANELSAFLDAFSQLAQFISVKENLNRNLQQYVPVISAAKQDASSIRNAALALDAFLKINADIIAQANAAESLRVNAKESTKQGSDPITFSIEEANQDYTTKDGTQAQRWSVTLQTHDCQPISGITKDPAIEIPGWDSHLVSNNDASEDCDYTYYYTKPGKGPVTYLTQETAQTLSDRQVVLPGMQVLARQDALASMYMVRNNNIYGKITEGFVFRTPTATFKNPFHPTLSSFEPLNIACLNPSQDKPSKCSLEQHLNNLFSTLFYDEYQGGITLQLNIGYSYHLAEGLTEEPIDLPIAILPPTPVTIGANGEPEGDIITSLAKSITDWADTHCPSCNAAQLNIALNIMSNLTENPMPLLNLQDLYLCTDDIVPPLPALEGSGETV